MIKRFNAQHEQRFKNANVKIQEKKGGGIWPKLYQALYHNNVRWLRYCEMSHTNEDTFCLIREKSSFVRISTFSLSNLDTSELQGREGAGEMIKN